MIWGNEESHNEKTDFCRLTGLILFLDFEKSHELLENEIKLNTG